MDSKLRSVAFVTCVLVLGSAVGGCRWFRRSGSASGGWSDDGYDPDPGYADSSLVLENGFQSGDMGYVRGYSGSTIVAEGNSYEDGYGGGGSLLRLESVGRGWWVMSLVSLEGRRLEDLSPGTYQTISSAYEDDGDGLEIDVTGCSGPSQGNWDYDRHAEQAELVITDLGNGWMRAELTATFLANDGSTQIATVDFDYRTVR